MAAIEQLRRARLSGLRIARRLGLPASTVGAVLRRFGLGRLKALDERPEIIRYERREPGELIHIDTRKLGRIEVIGHRITGDRSRMARAAAWRPVGIRIRRGHRPAAASCRAGNRASPA